MGKTSNKPCCNQIDSKGDVKACQNTKCAEYNLGRHHNRNHRNDAMHSHGTGHGHKFPHGPHHGHLAHRGVTTNPNRHVSAAHLAPHVWGSTQGDIISREPGPIHVEAATRKGDCDPVDLSQWVDCLGVTLNAGAFRRENDIPKGNPTDYNYSPVSTRYDIATLDANGYLYTTDKLLLNYLDSKLDDQRGLFVRNSKEDESDPGSDEVPFLVSSVESNGKRTKWNEDAGGHGAVNIIGAPEHPIYIKNCSRTVEDPNTGNKCTNKEAIYVRGNGRKHIGSLDQAGCNALQISNTWTQNRPHDNMPSATDGLYPDPIIVQGNYSVKCLDNDGNDKDQNFTSAIPVAIVGQKINYDVEISNDLGKALPVNQPYKDTYATVGDHGLIEDEQHKVYKGLQNTDRVPFEVIPSQAENLSELNEWKVKSNAYKDDQELSQKLSNSIRIASADNKLEIPITNGDAPLRVCLDDDGNDKRHKVRVCNDTPEKSRSTPGTDVDATNLSEINTSIRVVNNKLWCEDEMDITVLATEKERKDAAENLNRESSIRVVGAQGGVVIDADTWADVSAKVYQSSEGELNATVYQSKEGDLKATVYQPAESVDELNATVYQSKEGDLKATVYQPAESVDELNATVYQSKEGDLKATVYQPAESVDELNATVYQSKEGNLKATVYQPAESVDELNATVYQSKEGNLKATVYQPAESVDELNATVYQSKEGNLKATVYQPAESVDELNATVYQSKEGNLKATVYQPAESVDELNATVYQSKEGNLKATVYQPAESVDELNATVYQSKEGNLKATVYQPAESVDELNATVYQSKEGNLKATVYQPAESVNELNATVYQSKEGNLKATVHSADNFEVQLTNQIGPKSTGETGWGDDKGGIASGTKWRPIPLFNRRKYELVGNEQPQYDDIMVEAPTDAGEQNGQYCLVIDELTNLKAVEGDVKVINGGDDFKVVSKTDTNNRTMVNVSLHQYQSGNSNLVEGSPGQLGDAANFKLAERAVRVEGNHSGGLVVQGQAGVGERDECSESHPVRVTTFNQSRGGYVTNGAGKSTFVGEDAGKIQGLRGEDEVTNNGESIKHQLEVFVSNRVPKAAKTTDEGSFDKFRDANTGKDPDSIKEYKDFGGNSDAVLCDGGWDKKNNIHHLGTVPVDVVNIPEVKFPDELTLANLRTKTINESSSFPLDFATDPECVIDANSLGGQGHKVKPVLVASIVPNVEADPATSGEQFVDKTNVDQTGFPTYLKTKSFVKTDGSVNTSRGKKGEDIEMTPGRGLPSDIRSYNIKIARGADGADQDEFNIGHLEFNPIQDDGNFRTDGKGFAAGKGLPVDINSVNDVVHVANKADDRIDVQNEESGDLLGNNLRVSNVLCTSDGNKKVGTFSSGKNKVGGTVPVGKQFCSSETERLAVDAVVPPLMAWQTSWDVDTENEGNAANKIKALSIAIPSGGNAHDKNGIARPRLLTEDKNNGRLLVDAIVPELKVKTAGKASEYNAGDTFMSLGGGQADTLQNDTNRQVALYVKSATQAVDAVNIDGGNAAAVKVSGGATTSDTTNDAVKVVTGSVNDFKTQLIDTNGRVMNIEEVDGKHAALVTGSLEFKGLTADVQGVDGDAVGVFSGSLAAYDDEQVTPKQTTVGEEKAISVDTKGRVMTQGPGVGGNFPVTSAKSTGVKIGATDTTGALAAILSDNTGRILLGDNEDFTRRIGMVELSAGGETVGSVIVKNAEKTTVGDADAQAAGNKESSIRVVGFDGKKVMCTVDGEVDLANNAEVKLADGTITNKIGTVAFADNTVKLANGTITNEIGTVALKCNEVKLVGADTPATTVVGTAYVCSKDFTDPTEALNNAVRVCGFNKGNVQCDVVGSVDLDAGATVELKEKIPAKQNEIVGSVKLAAGTAAVGTVGLAANTEVKLADGTITNKIGTVDLVNDATVKLGAGTQAIGSVELKEKATGTENGIVGSVKLAAGTAAVGTVGLAADSTVKLAAGTAAVGTVGLAANTEVKLADGTITNKIGTVDLVNDATVKLGAGTQAIGSVELKEKATGTENGIVGSVKLAAGTAAVGTVGLAADSTVKLGAGTQAIGSVELKEKASGTENGIVGSVKLAAGTAAVGTVGLAADSTVKLGAGTQAIGSVELKEKASGTENGIVGSVKLAAGTAAVGTVGLAADSTVKLAAGTAAVGTVGLAANTEVKLADGTITNKIGTVDLVNDAEVKLAGGSHAIGSVEVTPSALSTKADATAAVAENKESSIRVVGYDNESVRVQLAAAAADADAVHARVSLATDTELLSITNAVKIKNDDDDCLRVCNLFSREHAIDNGGGVPANKGALGAGTSASAGGIFLAAGQSLDIGGKYANNDSSNGTVLSIGNIDRSVKTISFYVKGRRVKAADNSLIDLKNGDLIVQGKVKELDFGDGGGGVDTPYKAKATFDPANTPQAAGMIGPLVYKLEEGGAYPTMEFDIKAGDTSLNNDDGTEDQLKISGFVAVY